MRPITCKIVAIVFVFLCSNASPVLAGGWGLESGRAGPDDVARLVTDQVAVRRSETRIAEASVRPTVAERQATLTAAEDGTIRMVTRVDDVYEWWLKSVMEPAKAVAADRKSVV